MKFNIKIFTSLLVIAIILFASFSDIQQNRSLFNNFKISNHNNVINQLVIKNHRVVNEVTILQLIDLEGFHLIDTFQLDRRRIELVMASVFDVIIEKQGYFGSVRI